MEEATSEQQAQTQSTNSLPHVQRFAHSVDALQARYKRFLPFLRQCRHVVAPMVGISDLPFRLLCRRYAADVCYTQMLDSALYIQSASYRPAMFQTSDEDHPLVVQFAANDAQTLLQAALLVQPHCEAICLNLGCPQRSARRHHYGAFLCDDAPSQRAHLLSIVHHVTSHAAFSLPLCVKIRLLPTFDATLLLCQQLIFAGASLIAIHGRQRGSVNDRRHGAADLHMIQQLVHHLRHSAPPVWLLTNGNVRCADDIQHNLLYTAADGIMIAEALCTNPALYAQYQQLTQIKISLDDDRCLLTQLASKHHHTKKLITMANEYLSLVTQHPFSSSLVPHYHVAIPHLHLFHLLGSALHYYQLDERLASAVRVESIMEVLKTLEQRVHDDGNGDWIADEAEEAVLTVARERRQREQDRAKTLFRQRHVDDRHNDENGTSSHLTGRQRKHLRYKERKLEKRRKLLHTEAE